MRVLPFGIPVDRSAASRRAGGGVLEDFDNDGFLDLMVTAWELTSPMRLFRNNGDGTFTDVTTEAGVDKLLLAMGCNFGDLGNDGPQDVYSVVGGAVDRVEIFLARNRTYPSDQWPSDRSLLSHP